MTGCSYVSLDELVVVLLTVDCGLVLLEDDCGLVLEVDCGFVLLETDCGAVLTDEDEPLEDAGGFALEFSLSGPDTEDTAELPDELVDDDEGFTGSVLGSFDVPVLPPG